MNNVRQHVKTIMATIFFVDTSEIPEDCTYGDFENWESMTHLALITAFEEEFDIRFFDDEVMDMLNLDLIVNIIESHIKKN